MSALSLVSQMQLLHFSRRNRQTRSPSLLALKGSTFQLGAAWTDGNNKSVNCLRSSAVVLYTYLVLPFEIQTFFSSIHPLIIQVRGQGGTNSLSLVSEGCCTLFALCRNVSPPCQACIFSFCLFAFMSQVHYFVIIMTRKAPLSPVFPSPLSRSVKIEYCILKSISTMGLRKSASPRFTLLLLFMSHLSSSTLMHLFICCGLLYSFEAALFLA